MIAPFSRGAFFEPRRAVCAAIAVAMLSAAGCSKSAPTRANLDHRDVDEMVAQMRSRLAMAEFAQDRNPQSPRMTIVVERVENRTRYLWPASDLWAVMNEVAAALSSPDIRQHRQIEFTLPVERIEEARRSGLFRHEAMSGRSPTHQLRAVFSVRSIRDRLDRVDVYDCHFELIDLHGGQIVWADSVRFEKEMSGPSYH